jgi:surface protein
MDDIRRRVAMTIYESIGGDPNKHFDTVEEIYEEIDRIYDSQDHRSDVDPLYVEVDANGIYKFEGKGIQGYKPVEINVDIPMDEGSYAEGYSEGVNAQKSKLKSVVFTKNGNYIREDGYNNVTVEVPTSEESYDEGFEDGEANQKSKLESITIDSNGTYVRSDGYNSVEVIVDTQSYYDNGYNVGVEDGIREQKSKLESITIDSNGTYIKSDGYNKIIVEVEATDDGSYDEGYAAGIEDQKSKLESITITENGTYDKEDGYNSVNVAIDTQSYFERGYNIGVEDGIEDQKSKLESITITENGTYDKEDGYSKVDVNIDTQSYYDDGYNNGYSEGDNNGYERGYDEGVDNGIQEQKSKLESITIKSNGTYNKEDGYNKVIVEVEGGSEYVKPKIYNGFRFVSEGNNDYKLIKDIDFGLYDWSGVYELDNFFGEFKSADGDGLVASDFDNFIQNYNGKMSSCYGMFDNSDALKESPNFGDKTKNCLNMCYMFYGCNNLTSISQLDTSNVIDMRYMFHDCSKLTTIPQLDTSNVIDMRGMVGGCSRLTSIPLLNCQNVKYMDSFFGGSSQGAGICADITYCGGFKDLGKQSSVSGLSSDFLDYALDLTRESLMNIINNLYDRKANGLSNLTIKFGYDHLTKLTDEQKSIAVNKGWILS